MTDIDTRMSRIEGVEPRSSDFCLLLVVVDCHRGRVLAAIQKVFSFLQVPPGRSGLFADQ